MNDRIQRGRLIAGCLVSGMALALPGVAPAQLPDLVVTSIQVSPANPRVSDQLTFTATVRNRGTAGSPRSSAEYSLLPGLTETRSVDGNSTYTIQPVAVGGTTTIEVRKSTLVELDPGPNRVRICANSSHNHIREAREDNNCRTVEFTVAGRSTANSDLVVTALDAVSPITTGGAPHRVRVTVANRGTARARATRLSMELEGSRTFASVPGLDPGERTTVTDFLRVQYKAGDPASRSRTFTVCANNPTSDPMAESNTRNNCMSQPVTVVPGRPIIPDLVVTSVEVTPSRPGSRDEVRFTATIRNRGMGASPQSSASYTVRRGLTGTEVVDGNSSYTIPPIPVSGAATVELWTRRMELAPGPYRVEICANSEYRHIYEVREDNNCRTVQFTVAGGQPVAVARARALEIRVVETAGESAPRDFSYYWTDAGRGGVISWTVDGPSNQFLVLRLGATPIPRSAAEAMAMGPAQISALVPKAVDSPRVALDFSGAARNEVRRYQIVNLAGNGGSTTVEFRVPGPR